MNAERPAAGLDLKVPDSGRTLLVMYGDIQKIPLGTLRLGDVLIVHHETQPGVMFMQAVAPFRAGWKFESIGERS